MIDNVGICTRCGCLKWFDSTDVNRGDDDYFFTFAFDKYCARCGANIADDNLITFRSSGFVLKRYKDFEWTQPLTTWLAYKKHLVINTDNANYYIPATWDTEMKIKIFKIVEPNMVWNGYYPKDKHEIVY